MNENIIKTIIELIGYTGSILVVVSMLMTSVSKLRVVNTLGSIIFAIYALIIKSQPTAGLQVALIVINAVKLYKLSKNKSPYTITELKKDDSYIQFFTDFYKKPRNADFQALLGLVDNCSQKKNKGKNGIHNLGQKIIILK